MRGRQESEGQVAIQKIAIQCPLRLLFRSTRARGGAAATGAEGGVNVSGEERLVDGDGTLVFVRAADGATIG